MSQLLSSRAKTLLLSPSLPYIDEILKALSNTYDPNNNPNGKILLAVAENKLCSEMLLEKIDSFSSSSTEVLNYTNPTGLPLFKDSLALFLKKYIFRCQNNIDPEKIIVSPGCTCILHMLSVLLFEQGDGVLVPVPYYPAFDHDFFNLGGVHTVEVNCRNIGETEDTLDASETTFGKLNVEALERAYQKSFEGRRPIKALLLSNPHNPLGTIFSNEELFEAIEWCRNKRIHLIMDEIYALSILSSYPMNSFTSVYELLQGQLGDLIHIVWGFSKDFGGSGLRVGVMYSQNQELLRGMSKLADSMQVSNLIQDRLSSLIGDDQFIENYLEMNSKNLDQSYQLLKESLKQIQVVVHPTTAGLFCFCDFRSWLSTVTYEAEMELFSSLVQLAGVVLTPGQSCHCPIPGYYRVCYAWVTREHLEVGIKRLQEFYHVHVNK